LCSTAQADPDTKNCLVSGKKRTLASSKFHSVSTWFLPYVLHSLLKMIQYFKIFNIFYDVERFLRVDYVNRVYHLGCLHHSPQLHVD
jgi:hypothetical protein